MKGGSSADVNQKSLADLNTFPDSHQMKFEIVPYNFLMSFGLSFINFLFWSVKATTTSFKDF